MADSLNHNNISTAWVDGELRLVGLDSRMIGLLRAIDQSGSLNQAARQMGLSYKGAWQIIERANNGAPKTLVSTATGGSKGGGTCLTEAGRSLLALFTRLEQQHRQFLDQLNRSLADDPDTVLLLQRLVVKTSARNQIFGCITAIQAGAVNAEVSVKLKGGEQVITSVTLTSLNDLGLQVGADAVLLVNSADITLTVDFDSNHFPATAPCVALPPASMQSSARNRLSCRVIRVQQDEVNAEVIVLLPGGETLVAMVTPQSVQSLALMPGMPVWAMFKSNAPVLGVMSPL
ncbi:TOBE domain-containing protein [Methylobacter tundripaludum]|uniref:TOBE domain-containing protein n=1 Tax=Methylobacter tundripaludum TaxID=173365 RepID=UPI000483459C|nr:TOBE domain-containing protein [Methylobacter tundripaludum]